MPKSPRQILSGLELHLRETVRPARRLVGIGWRDFRVLDHPENADAVTVTAEAFAYLCLNDDGNWNGALDVLAAVKAYLDGETGRESQVTDVARLATLLRERPVRRDKVRDWFDSVYR